MDAHISLIVPVYNVEQYLPRCLASIQAQTIFDQIDVILVDDGSTDASGRICDEFAAQYENARVIHKENGGVSSARNAGLDAATGEFIGFVDSDDFVEPECFARAYGAAARTGADVVCLGFASVWGDEAVMKIAGGEETLFDGNARAFSALFDARFKYFCWDKIYRRALYDGLRYPQGRIYEDAYLLPMVVSRAQKLLLLPDVLYYYRMRPMSITHTRDSRLNQWLEATYPLVELAREKYPQYLDLAWGRYNIIQLRSLDAIFECDHFRRHPCWKFQYRLLRKRLGSLLFLRCPQVRFMRRVYALAALLCPDLVAAYVRARCRKNRSILSYER